MDRHGLFFASATDTGSHPYVFPPFHDRSPDRRGHSKRKRRLRRLEVLESRRVLATWIVNTAVDAVDADPGDGVCEVAPGGECTLRAAIQESNATAGGNDPNVIEVPAGTFALALQGTDEGQAATGDLDITGDVIVRGAGAGNTVIDGMQIDRVFDIVRGEVQIQGVTIRGGSIIDEEASVEGSGGGIRNEGNLTVRDSTITGNVATVGAGVANYSGSLQIFRSTISGNGDANTRRGGGIANKAYYDPATLEVTDSTITGNRADIGGGIDNYGYDGVADATLIRSTLSGNVANNGGAIANESQYLYGEAVQANLRMRNSTISGNTANATGGGLVNQASAESTASVVIDNSTIASNTATTSGGGLFQFESTGASLTLTSSIVAGNQSAAAADLSSTSATASFTLVQSDEGHSIVNGVSGNLVGLNPLLGPLQDNGGVTLTHAPETISPVVDKGTNLFLLSSDQRGSAFARTVDLPFNFNASDGTDMGSVEIGQVAATEDFGDAPEGIEIDGIMRNYPTTLAQDGARHTVVDGAPSLGSLGPDSESDGQTSRDADGDDNGGIDDEDAVSSGIQIAPGQTLSDVVIQHSGGTSGGVLNGWIDFNLDGDWDDAGEQILTDLAIAAGAGSTPLANVTVPASASQGRSFMRLRISTESGLTPRGLANDGEVEDVAVTIGTPPPQIADLSLTHSVDNENPSLGDRVEFVITIFNGGPDTATGVQVGSFLSFDLIFVSSSETQGRYDSFDEIWDVGTLSPGSNATLRIVTEVDSTDPISQTAEVIASDQLDPDSTPDNGVEGEDDQQTVSIGTCLSRDTLPGELPGVAYQCGAQVGAVVAFVRGTARGEMRFDQYDTTVDIDQAEVFAMAIADANGIARVPLLVTEGDVGETFIVQAIDIGPGRGKSNTLPIQITQSDLFTPNTNLSNPADVNNDGRVSALDALIVINRIEAEAVSGELVEAYFGNQRYFPDTNADGKISARDALLVINRIGEDLT